MRKYPRSRVRPVTVRMSSYPDKDIRWEFEDMSMITTQMEYIILCGAADIENIYKFKKGVDK